MMDFYHEPNNNKNTTKKTTNWNIKKTLENHYEVKKSTKSKRNGKHDWETDFSRYVHAQPHKTALFLQSPLIFATVKMCACVFIVCRNQDSRNKHNWHHLLTYEKVRSFLYVDVSIFYFAGRFFFSRSCIREKKCFTLQYRLLQTIQEKKCEHKHTVDHNVKIAFGHNTDTFSTNVMQRERGNRTFQKWIVNLKFV